MRCSSLCGRLVIVTVLLTVGATSVDAGWNEFWKKIGIGYKRNNAWPDPFNEMDAMAVITPFEAMKVNGWRLHNTIGAEQFRTSDGALLSSGQERVYWIATQAPASRRQIFVLRGNTADETDARVTSIKDALASITTVGPEPIVTVTDIIPPTAPGDWATQINRTWLDQLPAPKLPGTSAAGTQAATN